MQFPSTRYGVSLFARSMVVAGWVVALAVIAVAGAADHVPPSHGAPAGSQRTLAIEVMKRATRFMDEKVSTRGGYVWAYLPDFSRRWGEVEARTSMIWLQPPGTPTMGHLFLDAYHASGDTCFLTVAEHVAAALEMAQHPSGGWNYLHDFAGEESLREWYATVGHNAWRLEEFQHYLGNATFDDRTTAEASRFLLRLYATTHNERWRPALDRAIGFVLKSQYPVGAWPQRFPASTEPGALERVPYAGHLTFNDDVAAENIQLLLECHQVLGGGHFIDAIRRAMQAFVVMQQPLPQAGWALQYTPDLQPAAARSFEPRALMSKTTAENVGHLIHFYELTGDRTFLARVSEALAWLESIRLAEGTHPKDRAYPTFVELGTNRPLFLHRTGSNVNNGRYFTDYNREHTVGHYASFRDVDLGQLRARYEAALKLNQEVLAAGSPLRTPGGSGEFTRFEVAGANHEPDESPEKLSGAAQRVIDALSGDGCWVGHLRQTSHPYQVSGRADNPPGDFASTFVGDESDTSPFTPESEIRAITTTDFITNMSVLIRFVAREVARDVKPD